MKNDLNMIIDLEKYFSGDPVDFSGYDLDLSGLTTFQQNVLEKVRSVPYGHTITYKELAERIGKPRAFRAVGQALALNPYPVLIPCHRVVSAHGTGGYCGGFKKKDLKFKMMLLHMEKNQTGIAPRSTADDPS